MTKLKAPWLKALFIAMVVTLQKYSIRVEQESIQFSKSLTRRRCEDKKKQLLRTMIPSRAETIVVKNEQEIRKQIQGGLVNTTGRKNYGETILRSDLPKRLIKPC